MEPETTAGLQWTVTATDTSTRIAFRGEFDLAAAQGLKERFDETLATAERLVVLDLDLAFMDSTGLRFLLDIKRALDAKAVELVLENVSAPVRRVLDIAGLTSWFESDPQAATVA